MELRDEFLSDEDLDLRNLSEAELDAWWSLWLRQARTSNALDEQLYSHGVFIAAPTRTDLAKDDRPTLRHGGGRGMNRTRIYLPALLGGLLLHAACAPMPLSTPTSVPATSTLTPSRTPDSSRTPVPGDTPTVTATAVPDPAPIGRAPADAAREVLTWFDPSRSPRIEWSKVMLLSDLLSGWAPDDPPRLLPDASGDWGMGATIETNALPGIVIVVAASTRSIGSQVLPWFAETGDPGPDQCRPAGEDQRENVVAVFDAVSGRALSAQLVDAPLQHVVDAWQVSPPIRTILRASPTPTSGMPRFNPTSEPSPTPTEPPANMRLARHNMPASLDRQFRMYPLRPGSSWTWRITSRGAGARWTVSTVTETVDAVWLTGPDRAVVRLRVNQTPVTLPQASYVPDPRPIPAVIYREVEPVGISLGPIPSRVVTPPALSQRIALEALDDPFREEQWGPVPEEDTAEDVTVTTRGGTFGGCTRFAVVCSAGCMTYRWFCPGIGYVRDEQYWCYTNGAQFTLREVIRWSISAW